ncbi:MAG TPA: protein-glutamate O-methyltransferase [Deltaproteobacteria bacterium]|nr:protein-glutamate O-methyltransferase [Deltaproteobacteria bacterium]
MFNQSLDLSDKEFQLFQEIIYRETGIHMSDKKRKLIVARLSKRLRALNLSTFTEYYNYLNESPQADDEIVNLVNRVTTNKTDFFRERHHFDFLSRELYPRIIAESRATGVRRLRIWSAGCSSGEEPYTLAMVTLDAFKGERGWDIKILATDLDTEVLQKAVTGVYPTQATSPVPKEFLHKYFIRKGEYYEVGNALRSMVVFRKLNLMNEAFPMKNPFDIIFCRNVIIYFDTKTKEELLKKFHRHLKAKGHIFIGHSESLMHMKDRFRYLKHTIYQKV